MAVIDVASEPKAVGAQLAMLGSGSQENLAAKLG